MVHIGKTIEEELRRQRRSVQWLSEQLYCDRSNIYKLFRKQSLDSSLILRLSNILHRDFFELYRSEIEEQRVNDIESE